jgi:GH24 family phage-related lysozyme (muramidase)
MDERGNRIRRIGGPYPSNEAADEASRAVSAEMGERPVEGYTERLRQTNPGVVGGQSPIPDQYRQYTPPGPVGILDEREERVAPPESSGGFLKTGIEGLLDASTKAMDRAIDVGNKYISAALRIDNPYKDPFKREVFDDILEDEGYRLLSYGDTKGNVTVGIGHLGGDPSATGTGFLGAVDRTFTTPDEATTLAVKDIDEKIASARNVLTPPVYDNLSESAKLAVVNMNFRGDLIQSPATVKLIQQGRMEEAAKEFLNNDDYRRSKKAGTGIWKRFEKNAERLRR